MVSIRKTKKKQKKAKKLWMEKMLSRSTCTIKSSKLIKESFDQKYIAGIDPAIGGGIDFFTMSRIKNGVVVEILRPKRRQ